MNIYVLISVVMISSFIFLAGVLSSPFKSILLPVNIPVEFEFKSMQLIPAKAASNGENPYEIVLSASDGKELLRLEPEEAHNALQIVASNLNGNGRLVWGSSNNLNLYAASDETFRPLKVSLSHPFVVNGNGPRNFEIVGTESGLQGVIAIATENGSEGIVVEDFKWPLAGRTIPIADGNAETGSWILTTKPDSPIHMIIDDGQEVTINYVSHFTSTHLYAKDLTTGQEMPVPFETTIYGSINPPLSQLSSYINSQIYLQGFGWLIPVAALMAIIWVDDRYRRKIRTTLKSEMVAEQ